MTWVPVLPALALVGLVVTLPGLVIGAALGLRREPWIGAAPLLSVAALGLAIPLSGATGLRWGLLPIALSTAVLAVVGAVLWWLAGRFARPVVRVSERATERSGAGDLLAFAASIAVGALWIGVICIHTIGDVASVQQTFDANFHVNAIDRVARLASASPATVAATSTTSGPLTFYPPMFHALGGLLVATLGLTPVVAANVVAVVIASVMWVPSVGLLVHVVLARHRFGVLAGALAACTVPLYPYLLMSFGVLWPNLLSISVLPAVLALVVVVLGQAETRTISWGAALLAGALSALGLYYAHPGAVFAALALSLPVAASALGSLLTRIWGRYRLGPLWVLLAVVAVWLLGKAVWGAVLSVPQLRATMKFDWPATMTMAQGLGNALALGTPLSPSSWLLAVLVVLGAVQAIRHPHQRWVVIAHGVVVYLYMLASGTDEEISQELTGFWYNDQYRVAALLPITAAPLVAIGLVRTRDALVDAFASWYRDRPERVGAHLRRSPAESVVWQWSIGIAVLVLFVTLLPGRVLLTDPASALRRGYYPGDAPVQLADVAERQLYERVLRPADDADDQKVIGDPWTGGALAGPISGRPSVYGHLANTLDADRELLAQRFRDIGADPAVCAAARRLDVGYAVEDSRRFWPEDPRGDVYRGLDGLTGRPGLRLLAQEGTVSVYRVEACPRG